MTSTILVTPCGKFFQLNETEKTDMNRPSSTITAAGVSGTLVGLILIVLAAFWPEIYQRVQLYPGAEAHLTAAVMIAVGYFKKENVLPLR